MFSRTGSIARLKTNSLFRIKSPDVERSFSDKARRLRLTASFHDSEQWRDGGAPLHVQIYLTEY